MTSARPATKTWRTAHAAVLSGLACVALATAMVRPAAAQSIPATPTITSGPTGLVNVRTATFAYSSSVNVAFKCSLDGAAFVACPSAAAKTGSISYSGLADGAHTFRVLAQIASAQSMPASRSWTVDATRPTVTSITRLDANPHAFGTVRWQVELSEKVVNVSLANFSLASTGIGGSPTLLSITPTSGPASEYVVSATSGPPSPSANPTMRLDLSNIGTIKDAAGNALTATFNGQTYTFDGTPPVVTVTKVNGAAVTFPYSRTGTVSSVGGACGVASGDLPAVTVTITGAITRTDTVTCSAGAWTDTVALTTGTYALTATQTDSFGNVGTSGTKAITVIGSDTTPPIVTLTMVNGSSVVNGSTIAFPLTTNVQVSSIGGACGTVTGDLGTVAVTITGPTGRSGTTTCVAGAWTFAISPVLSNNGTADGDYTIKVNQSDAAGNVGTTGPKVLTLATRSFTIAGNAVTPLSPGTVSDLSLIVTNPYSFALRIESITVTFVGTSACNGPANFAVSRAFAGPLTVPPGSSALPATVAPQIRMLNLSTSQDGCKSTATRPVAITLQYTGMASRA